jgi:hypothetical protein
MLATSSRASIGVDRCMWKPASKDRCRSSGARMLQSRCDGRTLIARILEDRGAEPVCASSAEKALQALSREHFDILLSDIHQAAISIPAQLRAEDAAASNSSWVANSRRSRGLSYSAAGGLAPATGASSSWLRPQGSLGRETKTNRPRQGGRKTRYSQWVTRRPRKLTGMMSRHLRRKARLQSIRRPGHQHPISRYRLRDHGRRHRCQHLPGQ